MKRLFSLAICLCLCVVASCATKSQRSKNGADAQKTSSQPSHRLVGTIVMVDSVQHFVLIDADTSAPPDDGAALKSFSNGTETGVLTVSPERRPPFMIADIVSGSPQKGDQVFE